MPDSPSEILAMNQIHDSGAHLLIVSVIWLVSLDDKTIHYNDSVCKGDDFRHIGGNQENRSPLIRQFPNQLM